MKNLHNDEKKRLKALYSYHILDTEFESHYDQMLELVSRRFAVPMCFINLVDKDRFWFKASYGASLTELCRYPGFCESTLQRKKFYEIPNALEEPTVCDTEWVQGDAKVRYYSGSPLLSKDGFAIGTLCMFDTKPRKFEQNDIDDLDAFAVMVMQLIELNKYKEQQLRIKNIESIGRMTGGVAHDFNNQLSGITSALDLLRLQPNLPERSAELIDAIRECADRSSDLVKKLLNLSRSQHYDNKVFDLHELLNDLYSLMIRTVDPSIEIKLELNSGNPNCLGDRSQLHASLLNILVNAKDAMPDGGSITILSRDCNNCEIKPVNLPAGPYTIVEIIDTGMGIPAHDIDKVFEPFYTTKAPENGTGLGLPSAFEVVSHHGGTILMESSNSGSIFSVFLPKAPITDSIDIVNQQKSGHCNESTRILLAEDEDFLRRLYGALLEESGLIVEICSDGQEALELLNGDANFDLLITDIKMPRLDGFQLYQAIQEIRPDLPVIMISGFADLEKVKALEKNGRVSFVQKPFSNTELLVKINDCLNIHSDIEQ